MCTLNSCAFTYIEFELLGLAYDANGSAEILNRKKSSTVSAKNETYYLDSS